jgi:hypothetical protein
VRLLPRIAEDRDATPFSIVAASSQVTKVRQSELDSMSRRLEEDAAGAGAPVLLSCFGPAGLLTPALARRYERLAPSCVFAGVASQELPALPDGPVAVRRTALSPTDPLGREWAVTAVGIHSARALVATGLSRADAGDDPYVEVATSEDPDVVLAAAKVLMERTVSV